MKTRLIVRVVLMAFTLSTILVFTSVPTGAVPQVADSTVSDIILSPPPPDVVIDHSSPQVTPPAQASVKHGSATYQLEFQGLGNQPKTLIEIQSFSWGVSNSGASSSGGGAGAGKITFNPFSITRKIDSSSPLFFQACVSGKHFKSVKLLTYAPSELGDGSVKLVSTVSFTDVLIGLYKQDGLGDLPTESVTLNFTKIEYK